MEYHKQYLQNFQVHLSLFSFKLKTVENLKCFKDLFLLLPPYKSVLSTILKTRDVGAKLVLSIPLPTISTASSDSRLGEMEPGLLSCWKLQANTAEQNTKSPTAHLEGCSPCCTSLILPKHHRTLTFQFMTSMY